MEKEPVLKIKYERVFDKYAIKVVYQNEEIFKRHEFFLIVVFAVFHSLIT